MYATNSYSNFTDNFETINDKTPGCAIGVVKGNKLVYESYLGLSNLRYSVPIDERTVFNIGSISKHITAALLFQLEGENKLSKNDTLRKFYPNGPPWFDKITLNHLLLHQSGLPDYLNDLETRIKLAYSVGKSPELIGQLAIGLPITSDKTFGYVLKLIEGMHGPSFEPGSQTSYSNTGYLFLADILENVSGTEFRDLAKQKLFEPLGMNSTTFSNFNASEIIWSATGYKKFIGGSTGYHSLSENINALGHGGMLTTVSDFSIWVTHLLNLEMNDYFWQDFIELPTKNNGKTSILGGNEYFNGLGISNYDGLIYSHSGLSIDGMSSYFWFSPANHLGYIQFCNFDFAKRPSKYEVFKAFNN